VRKFTTTYASPRTRGIAARKARRRLQLSFPAPHDEPTQGTTYESENSDLGKVGESKHGGDDPE